MTTEDSEARYRLPRTVMPSRYELVLEPDLAAGSFAGREDVTVTVTEPVSEIVLNAVDLEISGGSLQAADGRRDRDRREVQLDPDTERARLDAERRCGAGGVDAAPRLPRRAERQAASASTAPPIEGPDGGNEVIATTQMEATDAAGRSRAGTSPTSRPSSASR